MSAERKGRGVVGVPHARGQRLRSRQGKNGAIILALGNYKTAACLSPHGTPAVRAWGCAPWSGDEPRTSALDSPI